MRIILEGKAGYDDLVMVGKTLFGMDMTWLRRATMIPARSSRFRSELGVGNAYNTEIAIPGPVNGLLSAVVVGTGAIVTLNILTDEGGAIVWSVNKTISDEPVPFKFSVGKFRVEGTVRLEA